MYLVLVVFSISHTVQTETGSTVLQAEDYMDDGTVIKLNVTIDPNEGSAIFDFTGTGPQVYF